jgi:hypothetical protein
MKKKPFDCVEMKHKAQERIRREIAGLSPQEEAAYWQRIVEEDRARREAKRLEAEREAVLTRSD